MKRFLVCFLILPVVFVLFFSLSAFSFLEKHEIKNESVRQKRSTSFKINEEDFINTMFLRSSFFENGSDTNYFVNPTLKTSKSLTYNENGYLDFLKDSYATGIVFDKPSDKFLELYKNGNNYVKQYKLNRFYNVDKKFFLKDLTNFMYTYALKYDYIAIKREFTKSIKNLEQVKFNEDNGKLIDKKNYSNEIKNINNKGYIVIFQKNTKNGYIINFLNNSKNDKILGTFLFDDVRQNVYLSDLRSYFKNSNIKTIYRGDGIDEPTTPTIDINTGEITDGKTGSEGSGIYNLIDVVVEENIRVQQGGSANYEKLDFDGTQKIIFDFEIINEIDLEQRKKVVYRMILTINQAQIIRAGNISLVHYVNERYDEDKLNFDFEFMQSTLTNTKGQALGDFKINNYLYCNEKKIILEQVKGLIDINGFLKQFFSNVLMPLFTNRGAFLEANYLDFLTYDTVVVNFLGLNANNFLAVFDCDNFINIEQRIDYQKKGKNILHSSFKIMHGFYKDYLRVMFDLENRTYIQGYQKKFGLLVSNGFKIYPKYFYFSDKYKNLDVKIYSSHANKFYQTKYGRVFNFDYSVGNNFKVNNKASYLFDGKEREKYGLRVKDLSIQKVGYGVFELQAQKENEFYHYYDFNFGIYNGKDLTSLVDKPTGQWWSEQIENCKGYDMVCHLKNGAIGIVNNIPGVKQVNELASGIGKLFQITYNFFAQTFEIGKFNLDFYIVITNTFLLIVFMKFIRMF